VILLALVGTTMSEQAGHDWVERTKERIRQLEALDLNRARTHNAFNMEHGHDRHMRLDALR